MSLADKLLQTDQLQETINGYGKLPEDVLKKINYKFRLEWNYNSNSMEGNSLTKAETRSVMINNITVEGKPLRDVLEMRQHDNVVTSILTMGKGELNISEKRIKELHSAILSENDPEKINQVGKWKKIPNHLINYRNERFDFVDPTEVQDKMHELINWLNAEKEKISREEEDVLHPALLAFKFHLDYLTIHPFYDGNGRTARILTNIILVAYGYPPIYIKIEEKTPYYQYLADVQGYGGSPDLFYEFMTDLLIRSQNIVLNAIQGKEIEEPDDLDKRIFLLNQEMEAISLENGMQIQMTDEVFKKIYTSWLEKLLNETNRIVNKFNNLFNSTNHLIKVQMERGFPVELPFEEKDEIIGIFSSLAGSAWEKSTIQYISIIFEANYEQSKKGGADAFNCNYDWEIKFTKYNYEVYIDTPATENINKLVFAYTKRPLHKPLTEEDIYAITSKFGETLFQHIEYHIKNIGRKK
jgi:Fic family protein